MHPPIFKFLQRCLRQAQAPGKTQAPVEAQTLKQDVIGTTEKQVPGKTQAPVEAQTPVRAQELEFIINLREAFHYENESIRFYTLYIKNHFLSVHFL